MRSLWVSCSMGLMLGEFLCGIPTSKQISFSLDKLFSRQAFVLAVHLFVGDTSSWAMPLLVSPSRFFAGVYYDGTRIITVRVLSRHAGHGKYVTGTSVFIFSSFFGLLSRTAGNGPIPAGGWHPQAHRSPNLPRTTSPKACPQKHVSHTLPLRL